MTGVNLPMLLKLSDVKEETTLKRFASFIKDYGKKHLWPVKF